jgi:hypothetical protein
MKHIKTLESFYEPNEGEFNESKISKKTDKDLAESIVNVFKHIGAKLETKGGYNRREIGNIWKRSNYGISFPSPKELDHSLNEIVRMEKINLDKSRYIKIPSGLKISTIPMGKFELQRESFWSDTINSYMIVIYERK